MKYKSTIVGSAISNFKYLHACLLTTLLSPHNGCPDEKLDPEKNGFAVFPFLPSELLFMKFQRFCSKNCRNEMTNQQKEKPDKISSEFYWLATL